MHQPEPIAITCDPSTSSPRIQEDSLFQELMKTQETDTCTFISRENGEKWSFPHGASNSQERILYLIVKNITDALIILGYLEGGTVTEDGRFESVKPSKENLSLAINIVIAGIKEWTWKIDPKYFIADLEYLNVFIEHLSQFTTCINEYNYLEESLAIEKKLRRNLNTVVSSSHLLTMFHSKYGKLLSDLHKHHINILCEIAYGYLQKNEINAAAVVTAEAYEATLDLPVKLPKERYELCYLGIQSLYNLEHDDITLAKEYLDKAVDLFKKTRYSYYANIPAYACMQLGNKLTRNKEYLGALKYYLTAENFLSKLLKTHSKVDFNNALLKSASPRLFMVTDPIRELAQNCADKIKETKKRHLSQKYEQCRAIINELNLKNFLNEKTPYSLDSNNLTLNLNLRNTELKKLAQKLFSCSPETSGLGVQLPLNVLTAANFKTECEKFLREASKTEKHTPKGKMTSKKQKAPEVGISGIKSTYFEIPSQVEIKESRPRRVKQAAVRLLETPDSNIGPSKPAKCMRISWPESRQVYDYSSSENSVFSLSKPPYIPEGHWYAYVNEEQIKQLCIKENHYPENILKAIKAVLAHGLLSSQGTGVKFSKRELAGTGYSCKIRLLGSHGKGDIRIYGHIVKPTKDPVENKMRQLICFDHIEFHAHKKVQLPSITPDEHENKSARLGL